MFLLTQHLRPEHRPPHGTGCTQIRPKAWREHSEPISDGLGTSWTWICKDNVQNNPVFKEFWSLYFNQVCHCTKFLQKPFILIYLLFRLRVKLVRDTERDKKCCSFLSKHGASATHTCREVQRLCVGGMSTVPHPISKRPNKAHLWKETKPPYYLHGYPVP